MYTFYCVDFSWPFEGTISESFKNFISYFYYAMYFTNMYACFLYFYKTSDYVNLKLKTNTFSKSKLLEIYMKTRTVA